MWRDSQSNFDFVSISGCQKSNRVALKTQTDTKSDNHTSPVSRDPTVVIYRNYDTLKTTQCSTSFRTCSADNSASLNIPQPHHSH